MVLRDSLEISFVRHGFLEEFLNCSFVVGVFGQVWLRGAIQYPNLLLFVEGPNVWFGK